MSAASSDPRLVRWATKNLGQWSSRTIALTSGFAGIVASLIVIGGYWLFLEQLGNAVANEVLQFAGTADRLAERSGEFTLDEARTTQLWGLAFSVLWGVAGYALFAVFWRHCWNAGPAASSSVVRSIRYLPLAGALVGVVERIVTLVSVRAGSAGVEMIWGAPAVVVTLAWAKWVFAGMTVMAVVGMVTAAGSRASQAPLPLGWEREFRQSLRGGMSWNAAKQAADSAVPDNGIQVDHAMGAQPQAVIDLAQNAEAELGYDVGDLKQEQVKAVQLEWGASGGPAKPVAGQLLREVDGTGVSCSGGGIRAAAFAMGGLSALERTPHDKPLKDSMLGSAKYLSSVSGGGYAASAWRMAAGTGRLPEEPIIGDPCLLDEQVNPFPRADEASPNLLTHVRERRSFLANGPGGLPRALIRVLAQMAVHLFLIFASVYVLAWPFGKFLASWAVDALQFVGESSTGAADHTAGGDVLSDTGRHHWLPPILTGALIGPLALARLFIDRSQLRRGLDRTMYGLAGLAAGSAFVLLILPEIVDVVAEVPRGEFRLALTGIWAAIVTTIWQFAKRMVAKYVKYLGGVFLAIGLAVFACFVIDGSLRDKGLWVQWPVFVGLLLFLIVGFVFFNPDTWSLHDFYRHRLNGTFATKRGADGLYLDPEPPPMYDYVDAEGPRSIICCAAAREADADTGIASLSITFEPQAVTLFRWVGSPGSQLAELQPAQISHREYSTLLPGGSSRLASMMGGAAVSGAAVAPAMGRSNMATTNALLAAFNARLGVWVPNPAYQGPGGAELDRRVSPRMVNMFKEIFGVYDAKDPNLYATDGGHWDNLGLVELVRRRCSTIIAIDTSGDAPGTYNTLKDAIALARHECGAEISFPDDQWDQIVPGDDGLVAHNHMLGTVTYRDGHEGQVLWVKAMVAHTSSLAIQRYAASDRTFPNYSTGNQMLTDRQLTFLIRLGDEAMRSALKEHPRVVTAALAERAVRSDENETNRIAADLTHAGTDATV